MPVGDGTAEGRTRFGLILAALAVITAGLYAPALGNDFVSNYDDALYVTDNSMVQQGLSAEGFRWAFTTGYAANWHPLTWLSHMLDYQLFGPAAWGHHLINVLFHVANTVLLAYVLFRMTGRQWPSAIVAAFFAVHPLHVESVAWIAERKDVLSTVFWLLAMLAYLRYTEARNGARYLLCLVFLALGLMAKPMLVTLPCVLLLLDYWPLKRFTLSRDGFFKDFPKLAAEKLPLFAVVAASCVVTYYVQNRGTAVASADVFPFWLRVANAALAYAAYLQKTFYPAGLAAYYPHPGMSINVAAAWAAGIGLAALSAFAFVFARRLPFVLVGWLWFMGTLVPVIGLVQVGNQAYADRYTYVPHIGLFIALVWLGATLAKKRTWRIPAAAAAAIAFIVFSGVTWSLIPHWKNGETVFARALAVTNNNALAHNNLAIASLEKGDLKGARKQAELAVEVQPDYADGYYNLGKVLAEQGDQEAALEAFRRANELKPGDPETLNNLGLTLARLARLEEAVEQYRAAIEANPDLINAYVNLGVAYRELNLPDDALQTYLDGLKRAPTSPNLHNNLATLLARYGKYEQATHHFEQALLHDPNYVEVRYNYAMMLGSMQRFDAAREQLEAALRINPDFTLAREALLELERQSQATME